MRNHIAGKLKSGWEGSSLDQWAQGEPLQAFEHRTGKIIPARDLRSVALRC